MNNAVRITLLTLLALMTSACSQWQKAPAPITPADENWQAYQQRMQASTHWELTGKVGIRTPDDNNSAGFSWQQFDGDFDISLSGPFNAGAARIYGTAENTTLETDGKRFYAASPEQLLQQQLGWQLPVRELAWWIRGLPAPDSDYIDTMKNERLSRLQQRGWTISYSRYSEGNRYPEKLKLQYDQLRITLIVHEWKNLSVR